MILRDLYAALSYGNFNYDLELYENNNDVRLKGPIQAYLDAEVIGIRSYKISRERMDSTGEFTFATVWYTTIIFEVCLRCI
jgi:hypothetical protein